MQARGTIVEKHTRKQKSPAKNLLSKEKGGKNWAPKLMHPEEGGWEARSPERGGGGLGRKKLDRAKVSMGVSHQDGQL